MSTAVWLAEHRSVFTTMSSLLIIAGFLVVAARSSTSRHRRGHSDNLASTEIQAAESSMSSVYDSKPAANIVALLPPSDAEAAADRLGSRPTVLVTPFEISGSSEAQAVLGEELHDDVVAILLRSSDIAVIGRKSREWSGGAGRSIRVLGRELNAGYAVVGQLLKSDGRSRLAIDLLETATGGSIWSKTLPASNLSESGRIVLANQMASQVAAEVLRAEAERMLRQAPASMGAESLVNRANHSYSAFNRRTFHEIEQLARLAIEIKPSYPGAYGILAGALALKAHQAWTEQPEHDLQQAFSEAGRAVELSPRNPRALYWWGHVHLYGGRTDDAVGILQNAVAADTSYVPAHTALGAALILANRLADGIARIQHGLDLAPDHAQAFHAQLWFGVGRLELGDSASAQIAFLAAIDQNVIKNPADSAAAFWSWMGVAATHAVDGRRSDAEAVLERLRRRFPDQTYKIMIEHAEMSFAPNLSRLKLLSSIDALGASQEAPDDAMARSPLLDLFRKRASTGPVAG
ncbi:MAG: hypothetical protein HC871_08085 [Rhizobiales bacterium]|nr:hypothetical protein [Hyphomicrobiales bacterium]